MLALSKYSREQKGRRTYLLRCKKVGSVGKSGLGGDLERLEVISAKSGSEGTLRAIELMGQLLERCFSLHPFFLWQSLLSTFFLSLQDSETLGNVTVLQRVQILGEHLGIIFSG